jgi:hypothetical protein
VTRSPVRGATQRHDRASSRRQALTRAAGCQAAERDGRRTYASHVRLGFGAIRQATLQGATRLVLVAFVLGLAVFAGAQTGAPERGSQQPGRQGGRHVVLPVSDDVLAVALEPTSASVHAAAHRTRTAKVPVSRTDRPTIWVALLLFRGGERRSGSRLWPAERAASPRGPPVGPRS